ncbi:MAG: SUF system Fe-S cluster assembly regulator [Woeseiaceae bacterium]|jgi:FeS assembly SUF system regulator|nr:SUF system Fe-S cluster assembly regulator [Woeseiaceae bacterium]
MLRISKLTDYGTVVLAELAAAGNTVSSANDVAAATGLAAPTVSKLLKLLSKAGLVVSTRGARGGYRLARQPADISAAAVIDALEGPVSITDCSADDKSCDFESTCNVGGAWQRINVAIRRALDDVSLEDLLKNTRPAPTFKFAGVPVRIGKKAHGN